MTAIPLQREIYYPESDGQPMAESDLHRKEMIYLLDALEAHFRHEPELYIAGNLFLYYAKGDPRACVAPDVFLVRGVPKRDRKSFKRWEEGRGPFLVIEVTSDDTREQDLGPKKDVYKRLGVKEYVLHDPLGDYLDPRLQGYRLMAGRYQPIEPREDGSLVSTTTGLILKPEGVRLRLVDAASGSPLLSHLEAMEELERLRRQQG